MVNAGHGSFSLAWPEFLYDNPLVKIEKGKFRESFLRVSSKSRATEKQVKKSNTVFFIRKAR